MASEQQRNERRELKQKLFTIRRYVEGEQVKLNSELRELKKKYEELENFSSWSGFPEKWDIGDPYYVKRDAYAFDSIDQENFKKAFGKSYETIIYKNTETKLLDSEHIPITKPIKPTLVNSRKKKNK